MKNNDSIITINQSFIVNLNSVNATTYNNGSFHSSITFNFDTIERETECICMYCSVLSFTCPNSIYTINENNNLLSITINNVLKSYYVLYGFYDANTFMTQLLKSISVDGFTISLDLITNKFTLTNSLYDFKINSTSTINDIMGMHNLFDNVSIQKSFQFPYMCNFNGIQNINIQIENFNTNNVDSINKNNSSIVQAISVDNTCQQIIFNKTIASKFIINDPYISFISINIVDDLLRPVNLNNKHFNICLEFTELVNLDRFYYKTTFQNILDNGYNN